MKNQWKYFALAAASGLIACASDEPSDTSKRSRSMGKGVKDLSSDEDPTGEREVESKRLSLVRELPPCSFATEGDAAKHPSTKIHFIEELQQLMACDGEQWVPISKVKGASLALADQAGAPAAPKDFVATGISNCVELSWREPSGRTDLFTKVKVAIDGAAFEDWEYYQIPGKTKIGYCHKDLLQRRFQLVAYFVDKNQRQSGDSNVVEIGTLRPSPVSDFKAEAIANSLCADLTWSHAAGAQAYVFSYQVEGEALKKWPYYQTRPYNKIQFCEGQPGKRVTFHARSVSPQGIESDPAQASATFTVPNGAFAATAIASASNIAKISWSTVPKAAAYHVYWQGSADGATYGQQQRFQYYAVAGQNSIDFAAVEGNYYVFTVQAVDDHGAAIANSTGVALRVQPNYCTYVMTITKLRGVKTNVGPINKNMFARTASSYLSMDEACTQAHAKLLADSNDALQKISNWQQRHQNYQTYGIWPSGCGKPNLFFGPRGAASSWERCFIQPEAGPGFASAAGVRAF